MSRRRVKPWVEVTLHLVVVISMGLLFAMLAADCLLTGQALGEEASAPRNEPPGIGGWRPAAALAARAGSEPIRAKVTRSNAETVEVSYALPPLKVEKVTAESVFPAEGAPLGPDRKMTIEAAQRRAEREKAKAAFAKAAEGREPVRLVLGNSQSVGGAGRPVLPVIPSKIIVPFGREIDKVEVVLGK